jgi:L,D-peptidoglycan transpeptidase YkuD (ErfK/YbiS/YcfS/YnhG family)
LKPLAASVRQVIIVNARKAQDNVGVLTAYSRMGTCWTRLSRGVPAELGIEGLALHKHEGDGKTPEGIFSLATTVYGIGPRLSTALRYHHVVCGDWWDEQPGTTRYNQFVHVACEAPSPFGAKSEPLWTIQPQYQHFLVINYNTAPIRSGLGSAIFFHVSVGRPTAGCVAIGAAALERIIGWLNPMAHPEIVISTTGRLHQW